MWERATQIMMSRRGQTGCVHCGEEVRGGREFAPVHALHAQPLQVRLDFLHGDESVSILVHLCEGCFCILVHLLLYFILPQRYPQASLELCHADPSIAVGVQFLEHLLYHLPGHFCHTSLLQIGPQLLQLNVPALVLVQIVKLRLGIVVHLVDDLVMAKRHTLWGKVEEREM